MTYLLAIDQGTTGTKALLVDQSMNPIAEKTLGFEQHYPKPGWVEHDPEEIWKTTVEAIGSVVKKIDPKKIAAIGITNQRETICFWDRKSGRPLARAIVWQDRRTMEVCDQMKKKGEEPFFQERTGLLLDPYFSGTKAAWALRNWETVGQAAKAGSLAIGTIDSYLIARLTGGDAHVTEPSNASRTLAFHLTEHKWDPKLCAALGISENLWPEVRPSTGLFGKTVGVPGLPDGIPITGVLGDQQSALLGQACLIEGEAKCTYGTGAFLLMNTGRVPVRSRHRLLTTIAWKFRENETTYALEGSAFIAGAAVQFVRDALGIIRKSDEIEKLARSVESSEGVTFVPALTGLGAPYWNPQATGMFTGLTRGTRPGHLARATLEGIAFQNADLLIAMQKDLGKPLGRLNVDGGACANDLLMQFQADLLGVDLFRPVMKETTSLGAIFAAGLGVGLFKDPGEISKTWKQERRFTPALSAEGRERELKRWHQAVARVNL
jgi:glycerol kinase